MSRTSFDVGERLLVLIIGTDSGLVEPVPTPAATAPCGGSGNLITPSPAPTQYL